MSKKPEARKPPALRLLDGSFILGAACTVGFYAIMLSPSMRDTLLHRYTTEHAVDYVIVTLFFWGLVDVALKLLSFPREALALREPWLPEHKDRQQASAAAVELEAIAQKPAWLRESRIGKRLMQALEYVTQNGASNEYREHLQVLADRDAERTNANYTLLRFVVRVTPVLGFLGTVVHFGTALNGVSFDKMAEQLGVVVSEMGQAFNTTTVALAAAMVMMFAQFICEWTERSILQSVDRVAQRELFNRFEVNDVHIPPFLSVIRDANEQALNEIAATVDRQAGLWSQAIDSMLQRFDQRQQQEVHAWIDALDVLASRHEEYDSQREQRLKQLLDLVDSRQERFMEHIQNMLERAVLLRDDFAALQRTCAEIAEGEGRLTELQSTLAENLRVIHETQKIDEALHGLTGAIHLLTARHQPAVGKAAA